MASKGTTCPYCGKYSSVRNNGKLYVHKGRTRHLVSSGFLRCHASTMTWEEAKELKDRTDSGESLFLVRREIQERGQAS